MRSNIKISKKFSSDSKSRLYSIVFTSSFSVVFIFLLFFSFLIQPYHEAFAAGLDGEGGGESVEAEPVAADVKPQVLEVLSESIDEPSMESDALVIDSLEEDDDFIEDNFDIDITEEDENFDNSNSTTSAESDSGVVEDSAGIVNAADDLAESNDSLDEVPVEDDSDVSTADAMGPVQSGGSSSDTGNTDAVEVPVENSNVTTVTQEEEVVSNESETVIEARTLVTEENFYQFSRQSCVAIGDGTFHCSVKTDTSLDANSVVYADRSSLGNMEIFLRTSKGDVEQITENDFDDTAPHLDAESMRIVWQRMIDGRYQIMTYDLYDKKESQLTFSRSNNMEPKVSAEGIVWQAWDGNDWEIMFFDGTYTDQITDNTVQDVAPVIKDGYVLWSVLGGETQLARVYSIATGETMTIANHEGGSIVNPRFVLVYDTKFDNGDVVTQGFDPVTGLSAPIAAKPATEPIDIPATDSTGEIRALIQNKSSQKEKETSQTIQSDDDFTDVLLSPAVSEATLDLSQNDEDTFSFEEVIESMDEEDLGEGFELTDYDLVIVSPNKATTHTSTSSSTIKIQ